MAKKTVKAWALVNHKSGALLMDPFCYYHVRKGKPPDIGLDLAVPCTISYEVPKPKAKK